MKVTPGGLLARRSVVVGAVSGLAAFVMRALAEPQPARAEGEQLFLGGDYTTATTSTSLSNPPNTLVGAILVAENTGSGQGLFGKSSFGAGVAGSSAVGAGVQGGSQSWYGLEGVSGTSYGVRGTSATTHAIVGETYFGDGVRGLSTTGYGVSGAAAEQAGVFGASSLSWGVRGQAQESDRAGVFGRSEAGCGVFGHSGMGDPAAVPKTGVYGYAAHDSGARGVVGWTATGTGLHGYTGGGAPPAPASKTGAYGRCDIDATARGVSGYSSVGRAVYGGTSTGSALHGIATGTAGYALRTSGRLRLEKVAGVATLAANANSVTVSPGVDVSTGSYVLLTPQADPGVRRLWVTRDTVADTITIHANVSSASSLTVAWLVVG